MQKLIRSCITLVLLGLVLLVGTVILSWAATLLNQPSDVSVVLGVAIICVTFVGSLALLLQILKGKVDSNEVPK